MDDYDRDNFRRGTVVTLDLVEPGGSPYRHPRGYLYVISTSFDVENEQLVVELGCRLVLMALTEEIDELLSLIPVDLDVAQTTYQNCSASFASVGGYVYQDNQGALRTSLFFGADGNAGVEAGEWVSVLGVTTVSAGPLAGTGAIPDKIALSYQVPADGLNGDQRGRVDLTSTDSYYFLNYPASVYVRTNSDADPQNPNGTLGNINSVNTSPTVSSGSARGSSACGNTPGQPVDNGDDGKTVDSCNDGYSLKQSPLFVPAMRRENTKTVYDAVGAQVSYALRELRGPEIEANQQYFADKFAYCRSTWATACQPNGACPFDGLGEVLLGYSETTNFYGEANELIRTIVDTYSTVLSAAQPSDWRSGNVSGVPQDFNDSLNAAQMYRSERRDTTYYKEGNANVQDDVTYTSMASRGYGISAPLDALQGIKTRSVRRSTTIATVEVAPDRVNSSTTATKEMSTEIVLFTGRYKELPPEAGPYILEEQIPVPLLYDNQEFIDISVDLYADYITRFVKGDAFGLQIGESMRADVVSGWRPGQPFRYSDPSKNKLIALRMDATAWGVNKEEAAFVTNGIWIGFSDGTVTIPDNLVGNSLPDMGSGGQAPSPIVPPSVNGETSVDSGSFTFNVDVFLSFGSQAVAFGNDGIVPILPTDLDCDVSFTMTCFVSGAIVQAGGLLSPGSGGSISIDNAGSLITANATVISADLFS